MSRVVNNAFKSICEEYLHPSGVKVGGYPQELFKDLAEQKREAYECRICYLLAKEAQRCCNGHLFCAACIYAWCLTSEDNVDRCPVCRQHGSYRTDSSATAALGQERVVCPSAGCDWEGRLCDLRTHEHGLAFVGTDARSAGLPFVRSPAGEAVFPDFGDGSAGGFRASLEMERIRRRQRLALMQSHVLDGQARLAFLMSLFEEDLERRRSNLAAIASMQQRFQGQQFEQLVRLERELGEITASLLQLIESASTETLHFNHVLQRNDLPSNSAAARAGGGRTHTPVAAPASPSAAASASTRSSAPVARAAAGSAAAAQLASASSERLLQRESLANVLSRALSSGGGNGADRQHEAVATPPAAVSLDWPPRHDRRSPAGDDLRSPAHAMSQRTVDAPPPPSSCRFALEAYRSWPAADGGGRSRDAVASSSVTFTTAAPQLFGSSSEASAAAATSADKIEQRALAPSRGTAGGAALAGSALQQQQPRRQWAGPAGTAAYNPYAITYPPHRPLGVSHASAASHGFSYAASSARAGAALRMADSLAGSREPPSLPPAAASQQQQSQQQRVSFAAFAPPSSVVGPSPSARQPTVPGGSAAALPNSVARSHNP